MVVHCDVTCVEEVWSNSLGCDGSGFGTVVTISPEGPCCGALFVGQKTRFR